MDEKSCEICGSLFTAKNRYQKVCSFECKLKRVRKYAHRVKQNKWLKDRIPSGWEGIFKSKIKERECSLCHQMFMPSKGGQRMHPSCSKLKSDLDGPFHYFNVCKECRFSFVTYAVKHVGSVYEEERYIELFYKYKGWCETCKNKINKNRRLGANKAEKFIYDCLKKHFPDDEIVLLDRRQIRYNGRWREIDVYNRTKRFGFEYDDPSHLNSIAQDRDLLKEMLCQQNDIILIRIKYTEPLTEELILSKLKSNGIHMESRVLRS